MKPGNDEPKFCVNCCHFQGPWTTAGLCGALLSEPNLVTGKREPRFSAKNARENYEVCGPDARLYVKPYPAWPLAMVIVFAAAVYLAFFR